MPPGRRGRGEGIKALMHFGNEASRAGAAVHGTRWQDLMRGNGVQECLPHPGIQAFPLRFSQPVGLRIKARIKAEHDFSREGDGSGEVFAGGQVIINGLLKGGLGPPDSLELSGSPSGAGSPHQTIRTVLPYRASFASALSKMRGSVRLCATRRRSKGSLWSS